MIGDIPNQKNDKNTYVSCSSFCKVVVFHYSEYSANNTDDITKNLDSETLVIGGKNSNVLTSFNYSKSNHSPSGKFSFTLLPTKNWSKHIRPGDWILSYFGNKSESLDMDETLRCVGIVNSIVMSDVVLPDGRRVVRYTVHGEDFGKVFARYDIWVNPWAPDSYLPLQYKKIFAGQIRGNPGEIVDQLIDLFLGNKRSVFGGGTAARTLDQWYIPNWLKYAIETGDTNLSLKNIQLVAPSESANKFADILRRNIQKTPALSGWWMILDNDIMNSMWDVMLRYVNPQINEIFCEIDDTGDFYSPALYVRTIPFSFRGSNISSSERYFLDLPSVEIHGDRIFKASLGFNDNDRPTMMIMISNALDSFGSADSEPSISYLTANKYPKLLWGANRRYGLVLKKFETDYALVKGGQNSAKIAPNLLLEYNKLLYHWYENNALFETGQITIAGVPGVRLGKRLNVMSGPLLKGVDLGSQGGYRSYYIEAYDEYWEFERPWTQTLYLTRGIAVVNDKEYFVNDKYDDSLSIGINEINKG